MGIKNTLKNLAKAGGAKADEFKKARKLKASKNTKKEALGGILEKVNPEDTTETVEKLTGYKLSTAASIGGVIGVTGLAATSLGLKSYHNGRLGEIRGGELANMVSTSISPDLNIKLDMLSSDDSESAVNNLKNSMNVSQYGVEPKIVFALHELRN